MNLINNRMRLAQIKDFSNLTYGEIYPTDIDGFIDFGNKLFVFIELKFMTNPMPTGQRLALERLTDGSKVPAVCIVATHAMISTQDIDVAKCLVTEYRSKGSWKQTDEDITVKGFVDSLLKKLLPQYI